MRRSWLASESEHAGVLDVTRGLGRGRGQEIWTFARSLQIHEEKGGREGDPVASPTREQKCTSSLLSALVEISARRVLLTALLTVLLRPLPAPAHRGPAIEILSSPKTEAPVSPVQSPAAIPSPLAAAPAGALRIVDRATGEPIHGARLCHRGNTQMSDEKGLILSPSGGDFGGGWILAPGYYRAPLPLGETRRVVALESLDVRAAYLTFYGIGYGAIREPVLEHGAAGDLNGVIIDVKGDRGMIPYPSDLLLARESGANEVITVRDFGALMARLKAMGLYTIARLVVFKDDVLAHAHPEWAVIDRRTGKPWRDREGMAWVDPFQEEVWDYVIDVAREAAAQGFDEIQFDYIRFPTDGRVNDALYSKTPTPAGRVAAITGFLARAREALVPLGVYIAADLFGYTAFNRAELGIGQLVEAMAPYLDYLCPMAYPSGYHLGIPGYRDPVAHPYEVVRQTVARMSSRASGHPVRVRPWLQDFRDYAFDRRPFRKAEITAQIDATRDAGGAGWMLWNPKNRYTAEALQLYRQPSHEPLRFVDKGDLPPAPSGESHTTPSHTEEVVGAPNLQPVSVVRLVTSPRRSLNAGLPFSASKNLQVDLSTNGSSAAASTRPSRKVPRENGATGGSMKLPTSFSTFLARISHQPPAAATRELVPASDLREHLDFHPTYGGKRDVVPGTMTVKPSRRFTPAIVVGGPRLLAKSAGVGGENRLSFPTALLDRWPRPATTSEIAVRGRSPPLHVAPFDKASGAAAGPEWGVSPSTPVNRFELPKP